LKADRVAGAIRAIAEESSKLKALVDEVHLGSQEQARGIEQIATAVGQMQQVTQRVAANSEQSAAAGEELSAQAQNLHTIVERLRGLLGDISDGAARPAAGSRQVAALAAMPASVHSRRAGFGESGPIPQPARAASGRNDFPLDDSERGF
jgi:methyl-accepting chemotaxis protein/methyl-accepting chemotaxis protein-1 (serine sensor receptor)